MMQSNTYSGIAGIPAGNGPVSLFDASCSCDKLAARLLFPQKEGSIEEIKFPVRLSMDNELRLPYSAGNGPAVHN